MNQQPSQITELLPARLLPKRQQWEGAKQALQAAIPANMPFLVMDLDNPKQVKAMRSLIAHYRSKRQKLVVWIDFADSSGEKSNGKPSL